MLTLPPEVGNRYLYRNKNAPPDAPLLECEITGVSKSSVYTSKSQAIWKSSCSNRDNWTFWSDGKAKTGPGKNDYVAELVEDAPIPLDNTELHRLQEQRKAMQQRLKELSSFPDGQQAGQGEQT